jgi:hypothetical protein
LNYPSNRCVISPSFSLFFIPPHFPEFSMSSKCILIALAAVAVGFGGTFIATSNGGCEGGCPIQALFGSDSSVKSGGDCCGSKADSCNPSQPCCGTAAKAKPGCCAAGAACCEPGAPCCEDKTDKAAKKPEEVKPETVSKDSK